MKIEEHNTPANPGPPPPETKPTASRRAGPSDPGPSDPGPGDPGPGDPGPGPGNPGDPGPGPGNPGAPIGPPQPIYPGPPYDPPCQTAACAPDPGPGPAPVTPPIDVQLLISRAQTFFSKTCNTKFGKVIPGYSNGKFFSELRAAQFNQYPLGTMQGKYGSGFGPVADTDLKSPGKPINLYADFFVPQYNLFQEFVLVHEGVHRFTDWTDADVFQRFALQGLKPTSGYSQDFTDWIAAGCPN